MKSPKPITVLLADDHNIVRQGLCVLLKMDPQFIVVGEARTGREAVSMAGALKPDVVVMDIAMPELNGLGATCQILAANPAAKVLILSAHSDDPYVDRMCEAGVSGFLDKQTSAEVLAKAIRDVNAGKMVLSNSIMKRRAHLAVAPRDRFGALKENSRRLTIRESEVLQLVVEGSTNKKIAAELGISVKTVEKHRQSFMGKLSLNDTASLTRYAIAAGYIESVVQLTITE